MSILDRFATILKSNINDLLDKAEDPAKMIDQYMRELTESLAQVKEETAGVIAEETRCKRLVDENAAEIQKYDDLARKALQAGNEGDAKTFVAKKQDLTAKASALQAAYDTAHSNADKMRQMHDKLVSDIETLNSRREGIKAKVAVAKTQEKVNDFTSGADRAAGAMSAFDRMEAKADNMLDRANAEEELNNSQATNTAEDLADKYTGGADSAAVDDELAKMKKDMGLS